MDATRDIADENLSTVFDPISNLTRSIRKQGEAFDRLRGGVMSRNISELTTPAIKRSMFANKPRVAGNPII